MASVTVSCTPWCTEQAPVAVKLTVKLPAMQDFWVRAFCLLLLDIQSLDPGPLSL